MAGTPADDIDTELAERVAAITLLPSLTFEKIRTAQMQDADVKHVLRWKENQDVKPEWK